MNPIKSFRDIWKSLNSKQKTTAGVFGAIDLAAKGFALRDLARTDSKKIRGPKWLWSTIIGVVNTFGWLAYFLIGKKR
ncbi:PLDc N-terminal domain-containing protein [Corynebacterium aquatimens]|uniref:Cardiolipin synthase N-terminal domain-containing protein n=1 Tax=Corynebacterium aquatimens TaxID=1190508 RepID=A0A931GT99_9CORY|nr:PLDc N-terminal domain-containing protein [Corynebacterium aquatimens]MBG6121635.1 hypothetical protein [Corynebacterium aquatimens]WJY65826.1 hypothetical protein CAQUA_05590 [Corynebacterium aquatimens]